MNKNENILNELEKCKFITILQMLNKFIAA
jgi:hypothetical protein